LACFLTPRIGASVTGRGNPGQHQTPRGLDADSMEGGSAPSTSASPSVIRRLLHRSYSTSGNGAGSVGAGSRRARPRCLPSRASPFWTIFVGAYCIRPCLVVGRDPGRCRRRRAIAAERRFHEQPRRPVLDRRHCVGCDRLRKGRRRCAGRGGPSACRGSGE